MDEMELMEGMHLNVDLSVWLRRLSPATRLLLRRIAFMWTMTVLGTCIAMTLPWGMHLLGIFTTAFQLTLATGLWLVLNGAGYFACGIVFDREDEHHKQHPETLDIDEWDHPRRTPVGSRRAS